jgi:hypothetical protein
VSQKEQFIKFLRESIDPRISIDMITPIINTIEQVTIDDSEFDNIPQLASKIGNKLKELMIANGLENIDEELTKKDIEYIRKLLIRFMHPRLASSALSQPPPPPPPPSSASSFEAAVASSASSASPASSPSRSSRYWEKLRTNVLWDWDKYKPSKRDRSPPLGGGSTTSTRRKLHRIHRRTQYTNKHKRSTKNTQRTTIKRRKSYRKHNRTIKRRKNSRRHH